MMEQGFRGNCDSQASWGCAPALPNRFRVVSPEAISKCFPWNISLQLFPRNSCKILVSRSSFTRRGGLVRPASKSFRFSHHPLRVPKAWHRDFAACGQRSGLLALNLANIFEKLLDQKTFICLRLIPSSLLRKSFFFWPIISCKLVTTVSRSWNVIW